VNISAAENSNELVSRQANTHHRCCRGIEVLRRWKQAHEERRRRHVKFENRARSLSRACACRCRLSRRDIGAVSLSEVNVDGDIDCGEFRATVDLGLLRTIIPWRLELQHHLCEGSEEKDIGDVRAHFWGVSPVNAHCEGAVRLWQEDPISRAAV